MITLAEAALTTKWHVPASNKRWKKHYGAQPNGVVIASVTHRKGSNYKEMAVLYYGTGKAVGSAVLEQNSDSR